MLRGHTDEVYAVAFHPDGTRLATAGRDGVIWLWDLARGEEVVRLPGPQELRLVAGLQRRRRDAGVRLRRQHGSPVGHGAAEDSLPGPARGRGLRPEAERLVEQVWRQENDPAEVVAALRADRSLSEPLRQAALRSVLRRTQPSEPAPGNPQARPSSSTEFVACRTPGPLSWVGSWQ